MVGRIGVHSPKDETGLGSNAENVLRAADLLADIVDRNGSAGLMARTMANSPAVLQGYLELSRAMKRSKLDRELSEAECRQYLHVDACP